MKSMNLVVSLAIAIALVNCCHLAAQTQPETLMKDPHTVETLEAAVTSGDLAAVNSLLEQEPNLATSRNENGMSLLLLALYHGHSETAERLVVALDELDIFESAAVGDTARIGELLNADPASVEAFSPDGFTPLHLAMFFGKLQTACFLLAHGANVEVAARNKSRVHPIHSAAASRNAAMVRVILAAGGDPDAKQTGGHTALHSAVLHGNVPMVIALLSGGADVNVENDAGESAFDILPAVNVGATKYLLVDSARRLLPEPSTEIYGVWKNINSVDGAEIVTLQTIHEGGSFSTHMVYPTESGGEQHIYHDGRLTLGDKSFQLRLESGRTRIIGNDDASENMPLRSLTAAELAEARQMLAESIRYEVNEGELTTILFGEIKITYTRVRQ